MVATVPAAPVVRDRYAMYTVMGPVMPKLCESLFHGSHDAVAVDWNDRYAGPNWSPMRMYRGAEPDGDDATWPHPLASFTYSAGVGVVVSDDERMPYQPRAFMWKRRL